MVPRATLLRKPPRGEGRGLGGFRGGSEEGQQPPRWEDWVAASAQEWEAEGQVGLQGLERLGSVRSQPGCPTTVRRTGVQRLRTEKEDVNSLLSSRYANYTSKTI